MAWLKEDSSELEMLRSFVGAYCQDSFKASQNRQAEEQTAIDEERYELIEVYGQRALFSDGRISDRDILDGLYHYDLMEGDGFQTNFSSIEPNVRFDFAGSIITREPINFGTDGYVELDCETEPNFLGEELTLNEFIHGGDVE